MTEIPHGMDLAAVPIEPEPADRCDRLREVGTDEHGHEHRRQDGMFQGFQGAPNRPAHDGQRRRSRHDTHISLSTPQASGRDTESQDFPTRSPISFNDPRRRATNGA